MLAILVKAVLFVLLVPGVLVRLGPSFKAQLLIHGLLFAFLNHYLYVHVVSRYEHFDNPDSREDKPCPGTDGMYVKCPSGDCRLKTDVHSPCTN